MPANYLIDLDHRIVFSQGWGSLTDAELAAHQAKLLADPAFEPTLAQLWDLRAVNTGAPVSVRGVQFLAGRDVFVPWARRALVTPSPLAFKLARIFVLLRQQRGEVGIQVFCDLGPACQWVGLPPEVAGRSK